MTAPIRIHHFAKSGHAHRVRLFAALANIEHEVVEVDLGGGAHRRPDFLAMNPAGQVPVIEDGDTVVSDSNAILVYLAKTRAPGWLPEDARGAAEVQKFLTLAAGEQAFGPAALRLNAVFGAANPEGFCHGVAERYLGKMEAHLAGRDVLVGDRPTIADVALYSYTAHAPEGGVSLEPYPNVRRWLVGIEALPGFVPMAATKVGASA